MSASNLDRNYRIPVGNYRFNRRAPDRASNRLARIRTNIVGFLNGEFLRRASLEAKNVELCLRKAAKTDDLLALAFVFLVVGVVVFSSEE